jgi:hypothetical protein
LLEELFGNHNPIGMLTEKDETPCRSVIVLFLLTIVLPALALGDLKTLLALFLKQKRVRTFTWLDTIQWKKYVYNFQLGSI